MSYFYMGRINLLMPKFRLPKILLFDVEFSDTKERIIYYDKNTECPITFEQIKYGDSYLTCKSCNYNFSECAIVKHLNSFSYSYNKRTCPMCRSEWTDYCLYVNRDLRKETFYKYKNIIFGILNGEIKLDTKYSKDTCFTKATRNNKNWFYTYKIQRLLGSSFKHLERNQYSFV